MQYFCRGKNFVYVLKKILQCTCWIWTESVVASYRVFIHWVCTPLTNTDPDYPQHGVQVPSLIFGHTYQNTFYWTVTGLVGMFKKWTFSFIRLKIQTGNLLHWKKSLLFQKITISWPGKSVILCSQTFLRVWVRFLTRQICFFGHGCTV